MRFELTTEMKDYYAQQLSYARTRMEQMRAAYNEWNNAAYMEDSPAVALTYAARAELAHNEFLFWTSMVASLKCKLRTV